MHDGCAGSFDNGAQVVSKLRQMGFSQMTMPLPIDLECRGCENIFPMLTLESQCPACGMVYGVTPCHAHDADAIQAAGVNY